MNTKEAIEFCDEIDDMINAVEHLSDNSRSEIYRNFIGLRKLLKCGEKYEAMFNEIRKDYYQITFVENKAIVMIGEKMDELEQRYFPKGGQ